MFKLQAPLSDGLPSEFNWQGCTGLLLDAVRMNTLPHELEQWTNPWVYEPLYTAPSMPGLEDLSPRVIKIDSPQHPALQQFLAHGHEEWGYLLSGDGSWQALVQHLRWLTRVRLPHGQDVFLRLADPSVIHAVLSHREHQADATLFGPCTQMLMPDGALDAWYLHERPGPAPLAQHSLPYAFTQAQTRALDDVQFRNAVMELDRHMRHYFAHYQADVPQAQRWEHLHALAVRAYERGFESELDITLYANIHGYLGENALQAHPDLDEALSTISMLTPAQRIEKVAEVARCRALGLREPD